MYLRFVRLRVREEAARAFREFYESRIIPALAETPGCLYAGLLGHRVHADEFQSLTLWDTAEHCEAYERSLYPRLTQETEPYLASSTVWRVRLTADPEETADFSTRHIPSHSYVAATAEGDEALERPPGSLFLRIATIRVEPDRIEAFRKLYKDDVVPTLHRTPGCCGVFLGEASDGHGEIVSVTLWEHEQDAVRYELSGEFERLTRELRGTFAQRFEWQMALAPGADVEPGPAPQVGGYHIVTGRKL